MIFNFIKLQEINSKILHKINGILHRVSKVVDTFDFRNSVLSTE